VINAPSLANCSLLELGDQVAELVRAGIQVFHLDIMDGHYVPNLGLPLSVVSDIKRKYPAAIADVHLMVEAPESYVARLGALGADQVSFPSDGTKFAVRTATAIREAGMKPGVVVNPSQPVDIVAPYLGLLDQVVLMTVEPGVHGQVALDGCLERVEEVVRLRDRLAPQVLIEIDGGIDIPMARAVLSRGADVLVTGNLAIFQQPGGIAEAVEKFTSALLVESGGP